jgi:nucleotide-binding universal stress UspA family protein
MIEHVLVGVALVLGVVGGWALARHRRHAAAGDGVHRILLPFTGTEISRRALDAALRLARAEGGTLMPAYLATVPLQLPLGCPLPKEAGAAMAMLEAIEQRAAAQEVEVDARIERGRTYRHALERLLEEEDFDRVVVPAQATGGEGLSGDDLIWLLRAAPAEVLILRPAPEDHRMVAAKNGRPPATATAEADRRRPNGAGEGRERDAAIPAATRAG